VAAPPADWCAQGTPKLVTGANGCPDWECEGGSTSCTDPNPAGCNVYESNSCGAGASCQPLSSVCKPSSCSCVEGQGWACTDDCGGGTCVPQECPPIAAPPADWCTSGSPELVTGSNGCPTWVCSDQGCTTPNPAGCDLSDPGSCGANMVCSVPLHDACVSSGCVCANGSWMCLPDCGGGECRPAPP
jgi:hypothetical protein